VRGRFAPSPTGELHLGNARTALLAWMQVRSLGGQFVLRVEDLDRAREVPGAMARQLEGLRQLGITWDEGPDVGGPHGPYLQSQRTSRYIDTIQRLEGLGRVFRCYCSRAEVARAATAPHGPGDDGPRYPGTCRALTPDQQRAREGEGRKPALRFRVESGLERFVDLCVGEVVQDVESTVGDFVVQRADGVVAYQLAVVVDDAAMEITHVLRGEDLLGSTPRQLQLYRALGLTPPQFAHVGLVQGAQGERLSKRDAPLGIQGLLASGISAIRIRRALEELSGVEGDPAGFRLDRVPRGPVNGAPERLWAAR
jgi:glutamyl-tRNA synthetase